MKEEIALGWPLKITTGDNGPLYAKSRYSARAKSKFDLSRAVRYSGQGHLITFAPTGSGKGVSVIIPTLLTYPGSMIVIDPKGENFHVTARRRLEMGSKVYVLDPFEIVTPCVKYPKNYGSEGVLFEADSLNPFEYLISDAKIDDSEAQAIATGLAERSGQNAFWDNHATMLLSGLIQFVATSPDISRDQKSLASVIKFLYHSHFDQYFRDVLEYKQIDPFARRALTGYINSGESRTRGEILSFLRGYLAALSTETIQKSVSDSTIDLEALIQGEPITIYIVFPTSQLRSYAKLLRLWISVLMRAILARETPPPRSTIFLLDECAQLGELDELRTAITLLRGYGLQAWMFFQDLSQLQELYKDWRNLVNNCAVVQAFGLSRSLAAGPIAEMLGKFDTKDLVSLGRDHQVFSIYGRDPRLCQLMRYWSDPAFQGMADPNPLI